MQEQTNYSLTSTTPYRKKEYDPFAGTLCAICVFLVLMGHTGVSIGTFDWLIPYDSFHMPLFVFASGYLFKYTVSRSDFFPFLIRKIKRLILPFFIWNIVYAVVAAILFCYFDITWPGGNDIITRLLIRPFTFGNCFFGFNDPSWFLLALFEVELLDYLLRLSCKKVQDSNYLRCAICFVLAAASVKISISFEHTALVLVMTRAFYLLFYYELGYLYKMHFRNLPYFEKGVVFLCALLLGIVLRLIAGESDITAGIWNSEFHHGPIFTIVCAINGIYIYIYCETCTAYDRKQQIREVCRFSLT